MKDFNPTKMKRIIGMLAYIFVLIGSGGCSEDVVAPNQPDEADNYQGPYTILSMGAETSGLPASEMELAILAPDGSIIHRNTSHRRTGDTSEFTIHNGLKEGEYRLLYASYTNTSGSAEFLNEFPNAEFGLGSRIMVDTEGIKVIDPFNATIGYAGLGTKESPYIVSSYSHLFNMMMSVNDYDSNREIPEGTYFRQVCDIDMKQASRSCDMEYGWLPIGANTNTPFRGIFLGDGHKISNLMINRPQSAGIGLFGFVCNASFDGVTMSNCTVTGEFGVGALAGASISSGNNVRPSATFTNCETEECIVKGGSTSAAIGGILGATDMHTRTLISNCSTDGGRVEGGMNVGGITGGAGLYSSMMITGCTNQNEVNSLFSGAGGIVGTADTLQIVGSRNKAEIRGATASDNDNPGLGTGGIAGGSGFSWLSGCVNEGRVSGKEGVGGIIGSTRVKGSANDGYVYNQTVLRYCMNTGDIAAEQFVGGAVGDAQAGTYGVCNTGGVSGKKYVGGICGASSLSVIHNSANSGKVDGEEYVAGIIGKTTWGSLAVNQNAGTVSSTGGNAGGITALAGNNTVIHYCANYGNVTAPGTHPAAGIAAEMGDPRKWTGLNIAECVIGSAEIVMAFAGPVLAVAEHAIEFAESVEIIVKIVETSLDACLQTADYGLISYGIIEMVSSEVEEELETMMHAMADEASEEVKAALQKIRQNPTGEAENFSMSALAKNYADNISSLCAYYEAEGNDEKFNEEINKVREERSEKLEKASRMQEIAHTVVAGVAVVTSTVALVAGTIASGGAATVFLVTGSVAAIVGGTNAIIKTCTEFEHNAVVVSQCVNSGVISGNDKTAAIIGKMEDGCAVSDCMNTASISGNKNIFIGSHGSHCDMNRFISLYPTESASDLNGMHKIVMCNPSMEAGTVNLVGGEVYYLSKDQMSVASNYEWFSMGETGQWTIPAGAQYPIPYISQMQK